MKTSLISALLIAILSCLIPTTSRAESVIVKWEKTYNGPGNRGDAPRAVAVDSAGNVLVSGSSTSTLGTLDYYTAKYAVADGALLWEKRYHGPYTKNDYATAMAVDSAGNAIVTGSSFPIPTPYQRPDFYTAKYAAADGALLWERRYNGPANGSDEAQAVAVDSANNVIVTGISSNNGIADQYDYYTAKYAAANGALLWERRYNGPSDDIASGLAVDSFGNAIVTGGSFNGSNYDIYTAKYAATNGALLWERRYSGLGNGSYDAVDVAVDNEGNAIVTGFSIAGDGEPDFYTAKYAAANGALLWEKRYNGTENSDDRANAVQVDSAGNVFVTGSSYSGGKSDFYTAKYATANGVLLWEKRYNGTGNGDDRAEDVEVDNEGNALVTGSSTGSGGNSDLYTAKYAAASGALLWEKRYHGTVNLGDGGRDLAVDSAGGVIVTGQTNYANSSGDFYTVKYAPVDLDLDEDGLLDSWEIAHFGGTTGQSALGDTDGDGTVELLELAFGTDPLKPGAGAGPAVVVEGGYLTTTITKQPGVTYLVQTTATPGAGFFGTSTTVLTDTATTLKVRDNVLIGTQPARFMRVQVTAAP